VGRHRAQTTISLLFINHTATIAAITNHLQLITLTLPSQNSTISIANPFGGDQLASQTQNKPVVATVDKSWLGLLTYL